MSWSRFSALFITLLFACAMHAQPYWQKGTRLATLSANANLDGLGGGLTNAGLKASGGTAIFFNENIALGFETGYSWAPLTQSLNAGWRLQRRVVGRSDLRHSLLLDVNAKLSQSRNMAISGELFGNRASAIGFGAQYTYWFSPAVGLYFWPQLHRTNGGPSGLWDWQMVAPVGLQLSWQHKKW